MKTVKRVALLLALLITGAHVGSYAQKEKPEKKEKKEKTEKKEKPEKKEKAEKKKKE
jgi:hypothetical protein